MKTFLLIFTILFFFQRIKSTPRFLSKKMYKKYVQKGITTMQETLAENSSISTDDYKAIIVALSVAACIFCFVFYLLLASRFSDVTFLYILSVLQSVTVIISAWGDIKENPFSENVEDHKFYRLYFLFNVILDYIYYPAVIYMLLK